MLYEYKTFFGDYKVRLKKARYTDGDRLAILMESMIDEDHPEWGFEPFGRATVNIEWPMSMKSREAFLDTNNMPGIVEFMDSIKAGKNTGLCGYSGFCEYPLYRFDDKFLAGLEEA